MTPEQQGLPMTHGRQESGMLHNQLQQNFEALPDDGKRKFNHEAHEAFMRSLG